MLPAPHPESTESPCVKICVVEADVCIGCGRTLADIAAWSAMDEAQRRKVNARARAWREARDASALSVRPLPAR